MPEKSLVTKDKCQHLTPVELYFKSFKHNCAQRIARKVTMKSRQRMQQKDTQDEAKGKENII